ncbi:MAG: aminoacyl-tRNA hydrolase [Oscillospiraceae bacterium]|jgi:PTH1 family peptidyl-tRNA hydrolase|nr:aminoacyl-tRNA hydrolase [Oscillospiraceae bacterium]
MLFPRKQQSAEWLIVGLGNPGRKYENTRHNAGFIALDRFCEKHAIKADRLKFHALTGTGTVGETKLIVAKPQTYMNNSGQSVSEMMNFYKIPPERTVIIFDDISLLPGVIRIRRKGSHGGHNGMRDIIELTGSDSFPRIKMGVGAKPHPDFDLADWVLSSFTKEEEKLMKDAADTAASAAELIIGGEIDAAMSKYSR